MVRTVYSHKSTQFVSSSNWNNYLCLINFQRRDEHLVQRRNPVQSLKFKPRPRNGSIPSHPTMCRRPRSRCVKTMIDSPKTNRVWTTKIVASSSHRSPLKISNRPTVSYCWSCAPGLQWLMQKCIFQSWCSQILIKVLVFVKWSNLWCQDLNKYEIIYYFVID